MGRPLPPIPYYVIYGQPLSVTSRITLDAPPLGTQFAKWAGPLRAASMSGGVFWPEDQPHIVAGCCKYLLLYALGIVQHAIGTVVLGMIQNAIGTVVVM